MKATNILRLIALALIGCLQTSLYSMNAEDEFRRGDAYYIQGGEDSRKALEIFLNIIEDNRDEKYVKLAKLKVAFIYDDHLLEYRNAIAAYKTFMEDYPDNRLTSIIQPKYELLTTLRDNNNLDEYEEFQRLKAHAEELRRSLSSKKIKGSVLELYDYARKNYDKTFNLQIFETAFAALMQQKYYIRASKLVDLIDEKIPDQKFLYEMYVTEIEANVRRTYLYYGALAFISLCFLAGFYKHAYKAIIPTVSHYKKSLILISTVLFLYLVLHYELVVVKDAEKQFNYSYMLFLFAEYLMLIPLAIALNRAFSMLKQNKLILIAQFTTTLLLGLSAWIVFAFNYDYLWLLGL